MGHLRTAKTFLYGYFSTLGNKAKKSEIAPPLNVSHSKWMSYLPEHFNKKGLRILELG